ncbi:hypothetical protein D9757_000362 [Collybiopsis confluens]|uniref:MARVEL domain-containing protein n=1 Tax=Collybiopsis confluens TaxID=2823264 RepID=A0A8H5I1X6_9AGAR|nr:hypothetical protein D9757_000362 [Collybiopsis confluens]
MAFLPVMRTTVFSLALTCSLIVVALSAHFTWVTTTFADGAYFASVVLALAAAGLSIITLAIMIAVDLTRKGAFTSKVLTEVVWIFVLWVMWIAAAAFLTEDQELLGVGVGCEDALFPSACQEYNAIEAFSFLAWLALLAYNITLLIYAIVGSSRGTSPWSSSVREGLLVSREAGPEKQYPMGTGGTFASSAPTSVYPPQQQQQYPQYGQPSHLPTTAQV